MNAEVRNFLRSLGSELSPAMVQETQKFFAARFPGIPSATTITRDLPYGSHERHKLDVFTESGRRDAPVVVFVHGGGFVMGDKRVPGLPFYDNMGAFAVQSG